MLELVKVNRSFGQKAVLNDVSFKVDSGRLTGFVGANGAGKTTTMRIILGVLSADSGRVTYQGAPVDGSVRSRIGYMPEERGLYPKMKVAEQLVYLARLHGLNPSRARSNSDLLIQELGLEGKANSQIETLSLGNQQRAQIAASLVHDPEILVLDEPFSGLDPLAVDSVQGVLKRKASTGAPVLFSSHQLDVVERLCDDLVVIADGSIRAAGTKQALQAEFGTSSFEIETEKELDWLNKMKGVTVTKSEGTRAAFNADQESAQEVLRLALSKGSVTKFAPKRPTLSEIFKEVIG